MFRGRPDYTYTHDWTETTSAEQAQAWRDEGWEVQQSLAAGGKVSFDTASIRKFSPVTDKRTVLNWSVGLSREEATQIGYVLAAAVAVLESSSPYESAALELAEEIYQRPPDETTPDERENGDDMDTQSGKLYNLDYEQDLTEIARLIEEKENDLREHLVPAPEVRPGQVRARKVGRNGPCPCGSGKKFKKCCMGRQASDSEKAQLEERLLALTDEERTETT